ncbi:MAG: undecaprenyl-diphosphate phosphatase [Microgenomates group bacterium]
MALIFQAFILGLIQGVTEFLPVSSSAHLVLIQDLFGVHHETLFLETAVHAATLIAVVIYFRKRLLQLRPKDWVILAVGTIPAVIFSLAGSAFITNAFSTTLFVGAMLLITGLINVSIDRILEKRKKLPASDVSSDDFVDVSLGVSFKNALLIGLFQAVAILPGVSRSGSTILGGLRSGLSRLKAFEFSFLLSIPAISGAMALQGLEVMNSGLPGISVAEVVVAMLAAFLSGMLSLRLLKIMIVRARFEWFGWYCGIVGIITILLNI